MKKIIIIAIISVLFNRTNVFSQTTEMEDLAEEISQLQQELTVKKAKLENLSKDYKKKIEFEEMNQDISLLGSEEFKLELVERGIDSENYDIPVAYWLIKAEIISLERQIEWMHADVIIETSGYTDYAQDEYYKYYYKNENGELIIKEPDISRKYEKGHIYYVKICAPIYEENASYYLGDLNTNNSLRIPMYNQN